MKTRLALALAVTLMAAPAAQAQTTPPDDPRVIAMRAQIDALDDLVQRPPCDQTADPARWLNVGTPDTGRVRPLISAHRGALTLAPENTIQSYEYAFAFGVPLIEVDIQQTKDGRFVALHDDTVDRTTNGTGSITTLTFDEVRALNAADYEPWKGGAYDPAQVASLEEVLALAKRVGGGLELDIKGSVTEEGKLTELVKEYGLIEESIFNSGDIRVLQTAPDASIIYNRDRWEPPYLMYEIAKVAPVFGSRRDEYNAESIAAVHDACGVVMPHAYDAGEAEEVNEFLRARAMGADGVQTNQPEAIVAAAGIPAPSTIIRQRRRGVPRQPRQRPRLPGQDADRRRRDQDGRPRRLRRGAGAANVTFAGRGRSRRRRRRSPASAASVRADPRRSRSPTPRRSARSRPRVAKEYMTATTGHDPLHGRQRDARGLRARPFDERPVQPPAAAAGGDRAELLARAGHCGPLHDHVQAADRRERPAPRPACTARR